MSEQHHIVKRQVIELKIRKSAEARLYQEALSHIYRQRVIPLIARCCDELGSPDQLHRIEMLELDIGALDPENLEEEFPAKVESALRRELVRQIEMCEKAAGQPGSDLKVQSQFDLFSRFARTGSLPWWADASRPALLAENLDHLLRESPEALRCLLEELAQEPQPLRRIVNHYTDEQLTALCALLVPLYGQALERDVRELLEALRDVLSAPGVLKGQLRQNLWTQLLTTAGVGGRQYDSLDAFYRAVLKRVASGLGMKSSELSSALYRAVQNRISSVNQDLSPILARLAEAEEIKAEPASQIPDDRLKQTASVMGQLSAAEKLLSDSASKTNRVAREQDFWDIGARTIDFETSEAEERSIGNAGLVILWPFLANFFNYLGLLDKDRRFMDSTAQQRAVGLLQVIAARNVSSPEYLLPLNKLLCGLELNEVFDFGAPLLETETAECANLLDALIAQAPILHNMSVDGFRNTFLLRPGLLCVSDGVWLLHVEQQTYDIVLERFPWSWEWIKLPWMETPLRVDW